MEFKVGDFLSGGDHIYEVVEVIQDTSTYKLMGVSRRAILKYDSAVIELLCTKINSTKLLRMLYGKV